MKQKFKNGIIKVAALIVMIVAICVPANVSATGYKTTCIQKSYNSSFAKSWTRYQSSSDGKALMTYGFDTFLTDQDFCKAQHDTLSHYAVLNNGSGLHSSSSKAAGKTATIRSKHSGSRITYYMYY